MLRTASFYNGVGGSTNLTGSHNDDGPEVAAIAAAAVNKAQAAAKEREVKRERRAQQAAARLAQHQAALKHLDAVLFNETLGLHAANTLPTNVKEGQNENGAGGGDHQLAVTGKDKDSGEPVTITPTFVDNESEKRILLARIFQLLLVKENQQLLYRYLATLIEEEAGVLYRALHPGHARARQAAAESAANFTSTTGRKGKHENRNTIIGVINGKSGRKRGSHKKGRKRSERRDSHAASSARGGRGEGNGMNTSEILHESSERKRRKYDEQYKKRAYDSDDYNDNNSSSGSSSFSFVLSAASYSTSSTSDQMHSDDDESNGDESWHDDEDSNAYHRYLEEEGNSSKNRDDDDSSFRGNYNRQNSWTRQSRGSAYNINRRESSIATTVDSGELLDGKSQQRESSFATVSRRSSFVSRASSSAVLRRTNDNAQSSGSAVARLNSNRSTTNSSRKAAYRNASVSTFLRRIPPDLRPHAAFLCNRQQVNKIAQKSAILSLITPRLVLHILSIIDPSTQRRVAAARAAVDFLVEEKEAIIDEIEDLNEIREEEIRNFAIQRNERRKAARGGQLSLLHHHRSFPRSRAEEEEELAELEMHQQWQEEEAAEVFEIESNELKLKLNETVLRLDEAKKALRSVEDDIRAVISLDLSNVLSKSATPPTAAAGANGNGTENNENCDATTTMSETKNTGEGAAQEGDKAADGSLLKVDVTGVSSSTSSQRPNLLVSSTADKTVVAQSPLSPLSKKKDQQNKRKQAEAAAAAAAFARAQALRELADKKRVAIQTFLDHQDSLTISSSHFQIEVFNYRPILSNAYETMSAFFYNLNHIELGCRYIEDEEEPAARRLLSRRQTEVAQTIYSQVVRQNLIEFQLKERHRREREMAEKVEVNFRTSEAAQQHEIAMANLRENAARDQAAGAKKILAMTEIEYALRKTELFASRDAAAESEEIRRLAQTAPRRCLKEATFRLEQEVKDPFLRHVCPVRDDALDALESKIASIGAALGALRMTKRFDGKAIETCDEYEGQETMISEGPRKQSTNIVGHGTVRAHSHVPHTSHPFIASSPQPFYSSTSIATAASAAPTYTDPHNQYSSRRGDDHTTAPLPSPPPPPLWVLTERLLSFYKCRSHQWNVQCSLKKMLVAPVAPPRAEEEHHAERGRIKRLEKELLGVLRGDCETAATVNLMDVFLTAPPSLSSSVASMSSTVINSNYFTKNVFVSEVNACLAKKLEALKRIIGGSPLPQRDGISAGNDTLRIDEESRQIDLAEHDHELVFSDEKIVFELLYEVPYEIAMAKKDSEMLGVMSASVSSAPLALLLGSSAGVRHMRTTERGGSSVNASLRYFGERGQQVNCSGAAPCSFSSDGCCASSQWKSEYFRGKAPKGVIKGREEEKGDEERSKFHQQPQQSVVIASFSSIIQENSTMHNELCFRMEESEKDALAFHLGYPSLLTQPHPSSFHEKPRRGTTSTSFGVARDHNREEEETNHYKDSTGLSAAADCARGHFTTDPTFYLSEYNNSNKNTKNAMRENQKPVVVTLLVFEKFMASQCDVFIKYMFASMLRATGGVFVVGGGVDGKGEGTPTAAVHWIVAVTALQWLSDTLSRILPPPSTPSQPSSGSNDCGPNGYGRNGSDRSELTFDGEVKRRGGLGDEDGRWSSGTPLLPATRQFDGNAARRRIREAFAEKGGARKGTTPPVSEGSFIAMVLMCAKEVIKRHRSDKNRTRTGSSTKRGENHLQRSDRYGLVQTPRSRYHARGEDGERIEEWNGEKQERDASRTSESRRGHHHQQRTLPPRHLTSELYIMYRVFRHAVVPMWANDFAPWIYSIVRDDTHDALMRRKGALHDNSRTKGDTNNKDRSAFIGDDDDDRAGALGVGVEKKSSLATLSSSHRSSYTYLSELRRRCDSAVNNLLIATTESSLHHNAAPQSSLDAPRTKLSLLLPYPIPLFIRPLLLEAALRGVVAETLCGASALSLPSAAGGLGSTAAFASKHYELYEQLRSLPYDTATARGGRTGTSSPSSSSIFKNEATIQQQQQRESGDLLESILRQLQSGDASGRKGTSSSSPPLPSLRPSAEYCCGTVLEYVDVFLNSIAPETITTTINCTSSPSLSTTVSDPNNGISSSSSGAELLSLLSSFSAVEAAVRQAAERWSRYAAVGTDDSVSLLHRGGEKGKGKEGNSTCLLSIDEAAAFIIDTFGEISSSWPRHAVVEALLATLGRMLAAEGRKTKTAKVAPAAENKFMMMTSQTLFNVDEDDAVNKRARENLMNYLLCSSCGSLKKLEERAQAVNDALEFGASKLFASSLSTFHTTRAEERTEISTTATASSINRYHYPPSRGGTMLGDDEETKKGILDHHHYHDDNNNTNKLDDKTSSSSRMCFLLDFIELCIEAIDPSKSTKEAEAVAVEGSHRAAVIMTQRSNSLASVLATDLRVSLADVIACVLVWSELGGGSLEVGRKDEGDWSTSSSSSGGNHNDNNDHQRRGGGGSSSSPFPYTRRQVALALCGMLSTV